MATGGVTRDDIERALWSWSEWRADQRRVDALLKLVDEYVTAQIPPPPPARVQYRAIVIPPGMRQCRECGDVMTLDAFYPDRRAREGRRRQCKNCANLERMRNYHLKRIKKAAEVDT